MMILNKSIYYLFSQVLERIVSFLLIIILFNTALDSEISQWSIFTTSAGIIVSVLTIGMNMLIVREMPNWNPATRYSLFFRFLKLLTLILLLASLFVVLFPSKLSQLLVGPHGMGVVLATLLAYILIEGSIEICSSFMRVLRHHFFVANTNLARSIIKIAAILLSLLDRNVEMREVFTFLLLLEFGLGLCVVLRTTRILQRPVYGEVVFKPEPIKITDTYKYILLFTLTNAAYSINSFSDRYFILHIIGDQALVKYLVYVFLVSPIVMIYGAITYIIGPEISIGKFDQQENQVNFVSKGIRILAILVPYILVIVYLNSNWILNLLNNRVVDLNFSWLLLMAISSFILGAHLVQMSQITLTSNLGRVIPYLLVAAFINLALNYVLISKFGQIGIYIANLASNIFLLLVSSIFIRSLKHSLSRGIWMPILVFLSRITFFVILIKFFSWSIESYDEQFWILNFLALLMMLLETTLWKRGLKNVKKNAD